MTSNDTTLKSSCNNARKNKNITSGYYTWTKHKLVLCLLFDFFFAYLLSPSLAKKQSHSHPKRVHTITYTLYCVPPNTNTFALFFCFVIDSHTIFCLVVFVFQSIRCFFALILLFISTSAARNSSQSHKHLGPSFSLSLFRFVSFREYTRFALRAHFGFINQWSIVVRLRPAYCDCEGVAARSSRRKNEERTRRDFGFRPLGECILEPHAFFECVRARSLASAVVAVVLGHSGGVCVGLFGCSMLFCCRRVWS